MAAKKKVVKKKASKKKVVKKRAVKKKSTPVKKKTVAKKKAAAKRSVKKAVKKPLNQRVPPKGMRATPKKFKLVTKNLILFLCLALLSFLIYAVSNNVVYRDFFYLLFWILGLIFLAFFISLLILIFLKALRR